MKNKNGNITIDIRSLCAKDKVNLIQLLFIEAGANGKSTSDVIKKLSGLDTMVLATLAVQMYQENQTARELLTHKSIVNPGGTQ